MPEIFQLSESGIDCIKVAKENVINQSIIKVYRKFMTMRNLGIMKIRL